MDIKKGLQETFIKEIIYLKEVDSTNDYAQGLAKEGYPSGTVVISDKQIRGRGRQHNKWFSPEGNLYMSILIRPKDMSLAIPTIIPAFTYIGALSCVKGIYDVCSVRTTLKWPNDIVYMDKKLGGVLTETRISGKEIVFVIVGIGLNINTDIKEFPEEIKNRSVSLAHICGKEIDKSKVLFGLLLQFDGFYRLVKAEGLAPIIGEWIQNNSTLNRNVRVIEGEVIYEGFAQEIDEGGRLVVQGIDGRTIHINNGSLYFL